ncbi:unnamed protein product, partial [Porites evermanni]
VVTGLPTTTKPPPPSQKMVYVRTRNKMFKCCSIEPWRTMKKNFGKLMLCPCQVQQSLLFWAKPCLIELFEGPHREDLEKSAHQSYDAFGL